MIVPSAVVAATVANAGSRIVITAPICTNLDQGWSCGERRSIPVSSSPVAAPEHLTSGWLYPKLRLCKANQELSLY